MSQEQAKQFIEQATQSMQSGQFQQALELLDQAAALSPSDSETQVLRGIALSQTGQPNEATEAFRSAIMLSPYNAKAYYNLAVHQYSQGNKVEALEMARETAKIDQRHAGARQLMATIEGELHRPVSPLGNRPENPNDPLSVPGPVAPPPPEDGDRMPPGVGGAIQQTPQAAPAPGPVFLPDPPKAAPEPPSTPYGGPSPTAPPPGGYYRQGYESSSVHSIAWIGNMGNAWAGIGWGIAAMSLLTFILTFVILGPIFMQAMSNPQLMQQRGGMMGPNPLLSILGYASLLGGILFTVLDLVDRRGNFLWLIPQVICSCCGFTWLILPIYMLAGRKS